MVSMKSLFAYFLWDRERLFYFEICCCVVLFMAYQLKNKTAIRLRDKIVLPSLAVFVLFLNPVSASLLLNKTSDDRLLRFFWIAPVTLVLVCVTVLLLKQATNRRVKILAALLIPLAAWQFANDVPYLKRIWNPTENAYKIPQAVIEICDYIVEDSTAENTAIFPRGVYSFSIYARQYRPEISTPYAFYEGTGENYDLYCQIDSAMQADVIALDTVGCLAVQGGYNYIVLQEDAGKQYTGSLSSQGYKEVYRYEMPPDSMTNYTHVDAFVLYRINTGEAAQ